MKDVSLTEVKGLVGTEVGVSDWITVDQAMIDAFAGATLDDQFIHTDPERAKAESPFGGTIAHGFLTLSLLSAMNYSALPKIREQTMGINYGFDKVTFVAPVKSGARIRGHFTLAEARFRGAAALHHRVNPPADACLCLEHEHARACGLERRGRVQAGKPSTDDDDVEIRLGQGVYSCSSQGSSTPQRAGFKGPGRPGKQQSAGQRSWLGPSEPNARRGAPGVSRSTMSSRTIATYAG